MDEFKEVWRPIRGFAHKYSVSNNGYVCLKKDHRVLALHVNDANGVAHARLRVTAGESYLRVDRLVLEAFHGVAQPGFMPHHVDGDITNNRADNLRWRTPLGWRAKA